MSALGEAAETFRQEALDLLEELESSLLDLEQRPGETALIDSAFRALHTVKGSGAMFGFQQVADFAHKFETAFDLVRKGKVAPSTELIAVALAAQDHIRRLIVEPDSADSQIEAEILRSLSDIVQSSDASGGPAAIPATPEPASGSDVETVTWRIRFRLPKDVLVCGTDPLLLLDELRRLGTCLIVASAEEVPALDQIDPESCYLGWDAVLTTSHPRSAIDEVFMFVLDDMTLSVERLDQPANVGDASQAPTSGSAVPVPLAVPTIHAVAEPAPTGTVEPPYGRRADDVPRKEGTKDAKDKGGSIRVSAERLDELIDRIGELVIAQARLNQIAAASQDLDLKSVAEDIQQLADELRGTTMGIRMVPIGSLFSRFRRLVHDLSRDLGKQIDLVTGGEETELDKTVVERLADPLIHLIRNAIDHGIDTPDERLASGKPARGTVSLVARHVGAEVLISITDDGKGINRQKVRAKAEEVGIVAPDARLTESELLGLIFHAGFSTASEITAVSGRGVGMDVVKRTIEGLRGSIDVASTAGRGTELTLRLPLTLAIIDGLLVRIGTGRYVIPLSAVEECVELSLADDVRSKGRSFLNIRGDLVPFLRLRELLAPASQPDPYQKVVIVSAGDERVGLVVDQVIGDHQTVIKSLSKLHADVQTFSGATILGDGTVALILDVGHLVELGQDHEERQMAS
jgi:two-component system chemotaxis sensor kinase CheA